MLDKLEKLSRAKEKFIIERRKLLESNVSSLQKKLYKRLFDRLIDALDTEQGNIVNNEKNLANSSVVDKIFKEFEKDMSTLMRGVASDYASIIKQNQAYYSSFNIALFNTVKENVNDAMQARAGFTSKGFEKDGFIDSFIKDKTVAQAVKKTVLSSVINGTPIKELTKNLSVTIEGVTGGSGILENHFRNYVYDTYSQFDRESSNQFAVQLDLNYAVYAGGLVDASRPFCIERNGKVFTRTEIKRFGTPKDLFGGYTNKSKGEFAGKNKDYIPERDMGGHNCGHTYNWITYDLAKQLRPDIPKYKMAA